MIGAALYLLERSAVNRARQMARKLKSPRYLIALIVGIGYLGLVFFGQQSGHAPGVLPVLQVIGTLVTLLLLAKWWLFGTDRTALAFSPAEIQFLFPAPVSRQALLGFKLLRTQLPIVVNVVIWVVILQRGKDSPLPTLVYALSLWSVFMLLMLHRLGVALTRDSLSDHGTSGLRRQWPSVAFGVLLALMLLSVVISVAALPPADSGGNLLDGLEGILGREPLRTLLLPFQLPFALLTSTTLSTWAIRFLLVLGMIGLHLFWVLRADRAFEEAAIAASAKRAELLDRWRRQGIGGGTVPQAHRRTLPLAAAGHPIAAIVWKNLTRLIRTSGSFALVMMFTIVTLVTIFALVWGAAFPEVMSMIFGLSGSWLIVLSLLGPQWIRNDLRSDLQYLDQLRTWPLSGGAIVTGQVLSSAIALTIMQLLLAVVAVSAAMQHNISGVPSHQLLLFAPAGLLVLAAINVLALTFQNAAAILFPAWVKGEIRPGGIEAMGQYMLTAGASLLLLTLALVGPVGLGAGAGYLLWPRLGEWSVLLGMVLGTAGIILESALLIDWLGTRMEQLDPTAER